METNSTPENHFATARALITFAECAGLDVNVSVHGASDKQGLELLQAGLLERIEQGAGGSNPPTGRVGAENRRGATAEVYFAERHR